MIVTSLLCAIAVGQGAGPAVYFVRKDSIYKSVQGKETLLVKHASAPAVTTGEKQLAFIRDGELYICDLESMDSRRCSRFGTPEYQPDHDIFPSWDPTSNYVLFSHADRYGVVRHGEAVQPMFGTEHTWRTIWNVYWCWNNKPGTKADISLFLGNETTGTSKFSVSSSSAAAFSPNGRKVAFCRNGDLWMATLDPSSILDAIREASWDEARVLACGTQEGGTRTSNETTTLYRISWSPDGKLLALSSDRYNSAGNPQVLVVKADKPSEKVSTFAGSDACFLDSGNILYVKPYTRSTDVWVRNLDSQDEKVLVTHAADPAVAGN